MEIKVFIPATYTIPDKQLSDVVREHIMAWGKDYEIFPGDLAIRAQIMSIGNIEYDETEFECHEGAFDYEELNKFVRSQQQRETTAPT